ncbi:hypothetical protein Zmor_024217 [Zophobas morio]|uniref:RING-type E3 ubiquitin transferase n=1 Tax=Zophobas morio TaxID=2755281 RepID=A0AA38HZZ7_9CUCU|nr:hypothetical protein Zmor_024217 [Zophobas morio]
MQSVRIRQVTVPLKIKSDVIFNINHTLEIAALQKLIKNELQVDVAKQKLYYGGKQLISDHSIADYKIKNNDVIQLLVTTDNTEKKSTKIDSDDASVRDSDVINTTSKYYKIGDLVDVVYKEIGAWFEAKIVSIYTEVTTSTDEEDLLFQVVMDRDEQTAPLNVNFHDIRPRAKYLYQLSELKPEMVVFVNYNINKPRETGYWYDFKIGEINIKKCTLVGTLMLGGDLEDINCTVKFANEVMKIEKPTLICERGSETKTIPLRKLPLYCKKCKDVSVKDCKECSCNICGKKNFIDKLIICDECEYTYHLFCLQPPLDDIPTDPEWYCPDCKNDENEIVKPGENLNKFHNGNETKTQVRTCTPKNSFGPILGIQVGTVWNDKSQIFEAGVHTNSASNVCGAEEGVYSIVLENPHEVLQDCGDEFYYNIFSRSTMKPRTITTKVFIQHITKMAKQLTSNCHNYKRENCSFGKADIWERGKPIRIVRSDKLRNISKFAPENGFRYDGIYKVVEYFPHIDATGCIVWRFLMKRDDPNPVPWKITEHKFVPISRIGEDHVRKKPKLEKFEIGENVIKFIKADVVNEKVWNECVEITELGEEAFVKKVKEMFTCVCCHDIVHMPITTHCKHNICHECLKKCFHSEIYYCPCCRLKVEKKLLSKVNHNLSGALRLLFPGYRFF